jgi:hypothetical protein
VEGESEELLSSEKLRNAFITDLGFDLQSMLTALAVLSQAHRHGFGNELSLSYSASPSLVTQGIADSIDGLDISEAKKIVSFLTLSESGIRRLSGRDVDENDVPYWERNKRIHRYAIRPLVIDGTDLRWGAEAASRAMNIWAAAVRDGCLPADFSWPNIEPVVGTVKKGIEKRLELRTEEIFSRYTPFVKRGIDFFRKFRSEGFEDVGDFDVLAYWPADNLLVAVECKYNLPAFTMKDARRLRDKIFGKAESDRAVLELLEWPEPESKPTANMELYVCRDVFYWMIHPPYPVSTKFVQVDVLDAWIKNELIMLRSHV